MYDSKRWWESSTVWSGLLAAFCQLNAEHEAIVSGDERLSFPEVAEKSEASALPGAVE